MIEALFRKIFELKWYVLLIFGCVSLFGFYSLSQIKIDAIPDITNKQVIVNTKTFSMDPTKVEKAVTYPIETQLYGIPNLIEMRSISKFGLSQIILIFDDKVDIYFARNQVMQRLSSVRDQIPAGTTPEIAPLTTGIGEILMYRVYNSKSENSATENELIKLRTTQEYQIVRELKKIKGVAEVDTIGGFERELHLNLIPEKLITYGMTPEKLINQIQTVGESFGGGYIEEDDKQKIVRTFADINDFEDVMNIPIKIDYTGKQLPLRHIVEVCQNYSQRLGAATYKGKEAVIGTVMMQSGENAKEVLTKVKNEIKKLNQNLGDTKIEILYDRQFLIDSTIKTVMKNLAEGILLVIAVLCLLLGDFKVGMIVASSLLFCILALAACMNIFNISANLMSLGAIDFGLLVDSSVVLVEYIVANLLLQKSKSEKEKSIIGLSSQVAKPIIFGIVIITLVYVPILMFSGIEGKTFKPMAINVIIAMITSLAVAILLMPILAYFFIKGGSSHQQNKLFSAVKLRYEKLLNSSLRNGKLVIKLCAGFFILSIALLIFMPSDFLPSLNEGDIVYTIATKEGSSLSKTVRVVAEIEQKLSEEKEIEKIFSRLGVSQSGLDLMPQNSSDSFVLLKKEFKNDAKKISEKLYKKIKEFCPECEVTQSQPIEMRFNEMLEGSRADLSLKIFGENLEELISITEKIKDLLRKNENIKEIEKDFINSIRRGNFVDVAPNYGEIARHQIAISNVNNDLKNAMAGIQVGNFYATEFPISIVMHLSEKNRNDIAAIGKIPVSLSDGGSFPLEKVTNIQESEDVTSIPRLFGKRYSSLSIYLKNTNYASFIQNAQEEIEKNKILPNGYHLEWGGRFENLNNAKKQIFLVVPLVILAIFFMLYKMFGEIKRVLIVFSSVPFALSGAIVLLFICQIPITISVYIGFIALTGISLLNSIILIDTFRANSDLKLSCLTRLKPISMTAIVASLGFLPMAFGHGIGAEVQQPIAITVIGGIISSTFTTLILSPVLLKEFVTKNK
ncbi:MAG: CusA/CzcA family heavy metal efflux RND transporter [Proteobacteria bacterium]|nr:CusA/CzcA family heavy metal efflux RND transporter [Pseudomonadota bacterium]